MINVSRVVTSPMLSQTVQVRRTGKGVWVDGVYTPGEEEVLSFKGIVTQASSRKGTGRREPSGFFPQCPYISLVKPAQISQISWCIRAKGTRYSP